MYYQAQLQLPSFNLHITIRKLYATSLGENAVHGADSDENAQKEIDFFFTRSELIYTT